MDVGKQPGVLACLTDHRRESAHAWINAVRGRTPGGWLAVSVGMAQNANRNVVRMNHVAINVPDIPEAITYYTEKMGYREAFRLNTDEGQPRLVYLHISQNSFLELQQANEQRPQGFNHYGLHVENVADAVAGFRADWRDGQ